MFNFSIETMVSNHQFKNVREYSFDKDEKTLHLKFLNKENNLCYVFISNVTYYAIEYFGNGNPIFQ